MTLRLTSLGTWFAGVLLTTAAPSIPPQRLAFFEAKIRPVLVTHCYDCHSVKADQRKGGLYLDSREALLRGGDSGPAAVPRNPRSSLLLGALKFHDGLEMPPRAGSATM